MSSFPTIINGVECYGDLNDYSNIQVLCEDEMDDFIWLTRDPKKHPNWKEIVTHLQKKFDIIELNAL